MIEVRVEACGRLSLTIDVRVEPHNKGTPIKPQTDDVVVEGEGLSVRV
jgi:hypothetical protein